MATDPIRCHVRCRRDVPCLTFAPSNPTPPILERERHGGAHNTFIQVSCLMRRKGKNIMGKITDAVLSEAEQLIRVWNANTDFTLGETTPATVQAMLTDLRHKQTLVDETRTVLTGQVDELDDKIADVNAVITRGRSGIRALFGPDSTQYNQLDGTRLSDRKPSKSQHPSPT